MPDMVKQHTERDPFWGLVRVAVRATGKPLNQVARCEWRRKNGAFPCAFAAAGPKNIQELQCSASSSGKHSIGIIMHDLRLIAVISLSIVA